MINILPIFNSKIKAMEILALLNNHKPVVRQGFFPNEELNVKTFCKNNQLHCIVSPFKVQIQDKNKPFSNKGKITSKNTKNAMSFYYISKDELLAHQALLAEIKQDDRTLGRLLGYPDCCINFFIKHKTERQQLDNDYEIPVIENSKGSTFPYYTNILLRHKDIALISHFPCSFNCKESMNIAKINEKYVNNTNLLKGKIEKHNQIFVFS